MHVRKEHLLSPEPTAELRVGPDGRGLIRLRGRLDAASTAASWLQLEKGLGGERISTLDIDATELDDCDGIEIES